jgi:hypothetical protein
VVAARSLRRLVERSPRCRRVAIKAVAGGVQSAKVDKVEMRWCVVAKTIECVARGFTRGRRGWRWQWPVAIESGEGGVRSRALLRPEKEEREEGVGRVRKQWSMSWAGPHEECQAGKETKNGSGMSVWAES